MYQDFFDQFHCQIPNMILTARVAQNSFNRSISSDRSIFCHSNYQETWMTYEQKWKISLTWSELQNTRKKSYVELLSTINTFYAIARIT